MPKYDVMVDGERTTRVKSEDEVRAWIAKYREDHRDNDPDATHVQVIRLRFMGGTMIPREDFF